MGLKHEAGSTVKVGTRDSALAMVQTNFIVGKLKELNPGVSFDLVSMQTIGDEVLDKPLPKIGESSLFTKELEIALEDGRADLLVHSLKDLPTNLPPGMAIGAIYKRQDPHDALILHLKHKGLKLQDLPAGSVIGTCSLRRIAQLTRKFPHLKFENVRGNLNTRLRKLDENGLYDALILAKAGLDRLGWKDRIDQVITPDECLYAVGQGALAVELNIKDSKTVAMIAELYDFETAVVCAAERAFLRQLEGGCSVPVGVESVFKDNKLTLTGAVLSLDGKKCVQETMTTDIPPVNEDKKGNQPTLGVSSILMPSHMYDAMHQGEELGQNLAKDLIARGADVILAQAKLEISTDPK
ncbi:porphobilinogen deaminase-like isoform X2 [Actinia tenebrosa]|uniref:hydroxymethylbilane synthase n=1 Tax=Actinia tenebrosa TaxID=6105 RepID=A0A6P8I4R8_ACTTE|nr:porphobilinogen deaminase-like isoform X2 [Actinia tenebrosa]